MSDRLRTWCWTIYEQEENKEEFKTERLLKDEECTRWTSESRPESIKYSVYQIEQCPTTFRRHLQGYTEFSKSMRRNAVKRIFDNNTMHLEIRRDSREKARNYCKKEDTREDGPFEIGIWESTGQGRRTDLHEAAQRLLDGTSIEEVAEEFPVQFVRYSRGLRELSFTIGTKRARDEFRRLKVLVLWGAAGTGKTRAAVGLAEDSRFILDNPGGSNLWWDGYNGEQTLIIDDFYGWIKWGYFLRVLDGYELRLPIKGSFTYTKWTRVIMTSNKHPKEWYESKGYPDELKRRIWKIMHLNNILQFETPVSEELNINFND